MQKQVTTVSDQLCKLGTDIPKTLSETKDVMKYVHSKFIIVHNYLHNGGYMQARTVSVFVLFVFNFLLKLPVML